MDLDVSWFIFSSLEELFNLGKCLWNQNWWRRRESNRTSVLKMLNLSILGMPELV